MKCLIVSFPETTDADQIPLGNAVIVAGTVQGINITLADGAVIGRLDLPDPPPPPTIEGNYHISPIA